VTRLGALVAAIAAFAGIPSEASAHGVVTRTGNVLHYIANDPGVGAEVRITSPEPGVVQIFDRTSPGGFAWGPCLPITERKAHCPIGAIRRLEIEVFDGNDTVVVRAAVPVHVRAGAGDDSVVGGYGDDTLVGDAGADTITGGGGQDTAAGGEGDDRLTLRDGERDSFTCGGGTDDVSADDSDSVDAVAGLECEGLARAAPASDSRGPAIDLEAPAEAALKRPRSLHAEVSMNEPGELTLSGEILIGGEVAGRLRDDAGAPDAPGQEWSLRPRFTQRLLKRARDAARGGERVVAVLELRAEDDAGNVSTERARVGLVP
jgi:hypothetical protein